MAANATNGPSSCLVNWSLYFETKTIPFYCEAYIVVVVVFFYIDL